MESNLELIFFHETQAYSIFHPNRRQTFWIHHWYENSVSYSTGWSVFGKQMFCFRMQGNEPWYFFKDTCLMILHFFLGTKLINQDMSYLVLIEMPRTVSTVSKTFVLLLISLISVSRRNYSSLIYLNTRPGKLWVLPALSQQHWIASTLHRLGICISIVDDTKIVITSGRTLFDIWFDRA